jgi:hypothetical protein
MPEKAAGSSPTSSRWALETPMTRARLGSGRRLRGSAAEVAVRSGRRSCSNRRYRCFLTPGPVRRVPKLGKEFTRRSGLERFGTAKQRGTRRLDAGAQRQDCDSLPYNKGGPGGQAAAFLGTEIGRRDPPRAVGTGRIRALRLTLGLRSCRPGTTEDIDLRSSFGGRCCYGGFGRSALPHTPGAAPGA